METLPVSITTKALNVFKYEKCYYTLYVFGAIIE